jgi:hypothetical protein
VSRLLLCFILYKLNRRRKPPTSCVKKPVVFLIFHQ